MNQVKRVTALICGTAPAARRNPPNTNETVPTARKLPGGMPFVRQQGQPVVWKTFTATASAGTIVNTVATALSAGIHAGTGAPAGIPLQLPNRISVQNANNARCRLCNVRSVRRGSK